jgi:hypothetical protein
MLAKQRPHALPIAQGRAFFNPRIGPFSRPTKTGKGRRIAGEIHRIIAPLTSSDHAAIKIEDATQFLPSEARLGWTLAGKWNDSARQSPAQPISARYTAAH